MYFRSQKKLGCEVSIHDAIDTDKDGNPLTYIDVISVDDTIAEDLDLRLKSRRAMEIVNTVLEPREKEVVVMRYGLNGAPPVTQREAAERLGISRSYISRIEKAALQKLGKELSRAPM